MNVIFKLYLTIDAPKKKESYSKRLLVDSLFHAIQVSLKLINS
ncbi:hypothetical protein WN66_04443 [Saccharomyces cerevisiae]|nr:hypothetical protein WN66_04443 [Saccharomyces cerevisiae]